MGGAFAGGVRLRRCVDVFLAGPGSPRVLGGSERQRHITTGANKRMLIVPQVCGWGERPGDGWGTGCARWVRGRGSQTRFRECHGGDRTGGPWNRGLFLMLPCFMTRTCCQGFSWGEAAAAADPTTAPACESHWSQWAGSSPYRRSVGAQPDGYVCLAAACVVFATRSGHLTSPCPHRGKGTHTLDLAPPSASLKKHRYRHQALQEAFLATATRTHTR